MQIIFPLPHRATLPLQLCSLQETTLPGSLVQMAKWETQQETGGRKRGREE